MMAESDALSYWPVTIVLESTLSHMATVHYGLVPKLSHHGGKNPRFALNNQNLNIIIVRRHRTQSPLSSD